MLMTHGLTSESITNKLANKKTKNHTIHTETTSECLTVLGWCLLLPAIIMGSLISCIPSLGVVERLFNQEAQRSHKLIILITKIMENVISIDRKG